MFAELMTSTIKERELRIRESLERKKGTRGRKKSKKTIRVQELIMDLLYVNKRLMRSSEIRIAVGRRVKGLSNYLFFSALMDLQTQGSIIKKKNLLNMKYTFYALSDIERDQRLRDVLPRDQLSGIELRYLATLYQMEKDLIFPMRFLF
ncbi:MAG TPA: hypothetical protein VMZ29_11915 [Candidatus Bathyarchaeia archaeon]|nr:hypothetical protein [Candidatus Bathyarchaeia archaeon]